MDERRQHFRLPATLPVEVYLGDEGGMLLATTTNISAGGVYFVCPDRPIHVGQSLAVEVRIPPAPGRASRMTSMASEATVIRTDRTAQGELLGVACQFMAPPEFHRADRAPAMAGCV
jgi:c-di-GMP-binding flagellar brake protein YcgR